MSSLCMPARLLIFSPRASAEALAWALAFPDAVAVAEAVAEAEPLEGTGVLVVDGTGESTGVGAGVVVVGGGDEETGAGTGEAAGMETGGGL